MAQIAKEPAEWEEFLCKVPPHIRQIAIRFPQHVLYKLKTTGQRCVIHSYQHSGKVTVFISGKFNRVLVEKMVRDVPLTALVECDLPSPGEKLGVICTTKEEFDEYIKQNRNLKALYL